MNLDRHRCSTVCGRSQVKSEKNKCNKITTNDACIVYCILQHYLDVGS